MIVYYFLAVIACWFGFKSLLSGLRYARYVRAETSRALPDFFSFVSVIAPARGFEEGFVDNVKPLLSQAYGDYEVLFVFDSAEDSSLPLVHSCPPAWLPGQR